MGVYVPFLLMATILVLDLRPALEGLGAADLESLFRGIRAILVLAGTVLLVATSVSVQGVGWVLLAGTPAYVAATWLLLARLSPAGFSRGRRSDSTQAVAARHWREIVAHWRQIEEQ